MLNQMLRCRLNAADYAAFVVRLFKGGFHLAANPFPFLGARLRVNSAIGNNLNVSIGEQQINQYAVIVDSVPHAKLRKYVDGALSRRLPLEKRRTVQCTFHRETDFADVCGLARFNCLPNRDQRLTGKARLTCQCVITRCLKMRLMFIATTGPTRRHRQSRHRHRRSRRHPNHRGRALPSRILHGNRRRCVRPYRR